MAKHDPRDYEAMSRAVEDGNYSVRGPLEMGATLRMGRPIKGTDSDGKSPAVSTRYPADMRTRITAVADAEGIKESELIRKAVAEYLQRHDPATPVPRPFTGLNTGLNLGQLLGGNSSSVQMWALEVRNVLLDHANRHPDFELRETAEPGVVETHGVLNLVDLAEHIIVTGS